MTTALVGGLLKLFSASSETDYEAALQKARGALYSMKKGNLWQYMRVLSRRKTQEKGGGGGGKLGSTFGQSQAKEPLHKGGGEDT